MERNKYGRQNSRVIDRASILAFFEKIHFISHQIIEEGRYICAFGKYMGNDAFIKIASTHTISPGIENEYNWNEAVHLVPQEMHPHFTVPRNFAKGAFNEHLLYLITDRFKGSPVAERHGNNLSNLTKKIKQIAQVAYELETLAIPADCDFASSKKSKRQKRYSAGHRLLASVTEWAAHVPLHLDAYLQSIDRTKDSIRTSVGHGEFIPWGMYEVGEKIGIIDGEFAGYKGVLYYDVAQFYIRLRNDYGAIDLAHTFLAHFRKILPLADQDTFWEELKPPLIQRYIGDLWGAAKNPKRLKELSILGNEILENKII